MKNMFVSKKTAGTASAVLCCLFLSIFTIHAASIDTVETLSPSMNKKIKAVIIKPDDYDHKRVFPVVYLLHGHGGNYKSWIENAPEIANEADRLGVLIVCPDGGLNSWYLDSPQEPSSQYETYITKELVPWMDKNYKTIKSPKGRAITGLSMGGHGALYLAFKNQAVFGAAGSMSGGVDLRPFPNNWQLDQKLGPMTQYPERWEQHSVINLIELLKDKSLALIIDCGIDDFFFNVNIDLHQQLLEKEIPHDFTVRPGVHDWRYWDNAVKYQLLFMHLFFEKSS